MRIAAAVELSDEQRQQLEKQARARSVSVRVAQRSKMILLAATGLSDLKIGAALGVKRQTVARWRSRYIQMGMAGIDAELLRLLNMRARLALKVGALKQAADLPFCDPERERTVLQRLQELNSGPLDERAVGKVFRRIICESRRLEEAGIAS